MRLPLRHIQFLPVNVQPLTPAHLQEIIQAPMWHHAEVLDEIDIPYAFDIVMDGGFYVVLFSFVVLRIATNAIKSAIIKRREEN